MRKSGGGATAGQAVLWLSAIYCHGELPIGGSLLAIASAASNGARTACVGDATTNLSVWIFNLNHRHTRKSVLLELLVHATEVLDCLLANCAVDACSCSGMAPSTSDTREELPEKLPSLSVGLWARSPEDVMLRLHPLHPAAAASDTPTDADPDNAPDSHPRFHGMLVVEEPQTEAPILLQLQDCEEPSLPRRMSNDGLTFTEKAAAAHLRGCGSTTIGAVTNVHAAYAPALADDLLYRQYFPGCECIVVTQAPVQPLDPLPDQLQLPIGLARWRWMQCPCEVTGC